MLEEPEVFMLKVMSPDLEIAPWRLESVKLITAPELLTEIRVGSALTESTKSIFSKARVVALSRTNPEWLLRSIVVLVEPDLTPLRE